MPHPSTATRAALFLDRDGTIIRDAGFLSDPDGVVLLDGAREALHRAILTHRLYLFTNQSGVGRGLYTLKEAQAVNARLEAMLALPPPGFSAICIAPEAPEEPAVYRKPSPRFIHECIQRDALDPAQCWMIGDRLSERGLRRRAVDAVDRARLRVLHVADRVGQHRRGRPGTAVDDGAAASASSLAARR